MSKYAIILLAAGSASRFGSAKQLATLNDETFIKHAINEAIKVTDKIVVVLGANYEVINEHIKDIPVTVAINKNWEEGMSTSIQEGMKVVLQQEPLADAIVIAVCDQPFLTSSIMNLLLNKYETGSKPIVASTYNNTMGTPVVFDRIFFAALMELQGHAGAKKIISQNVNMVDTVPFPFGEVDIDTREDLEKYKSQHKR